MKQDIATSTDDVHDDEATRRWKERAARAARYQHQQALSSFNIEEHREALIGKPTHRASRWFKR